MEITILLSAATAGAVTALGLDKKSPRLIF
jgi:hypothetical protein